ncbi:MAG: hypothetical protein JO281_00895 [Pseudonocardiales bacterium]|nr:hypothetical protein [Pseudonocardiales bacterium]
MTSISPRWELWLARRLDQLMAARRWPRKARILRRHPELLGADAQRLLEAERGEVRRLHAVLLRRARQVGTDRSPRTAQLRPGPARTRRPPRRQSFQSCVQPNLTFVPGANEADDRRLRNHGRP